MILLFLSRVAQLNFSFFIRIDYSFIIYLFAYLLLPTGLTLKFTLISLLAELPLDVLSWNYVLMSSLRQPRTFVVCVQEKRDSDLPDLVFIVSFLVSCAKEEVSIVFCNSGFSIYSSLIFI